MVSNYISRRSEGEKTFVIHKSQQRSYSLQERKDYVDVSTYLEFPSYGYATANMALHFTCCGSPRADYQREQRRVLVKPAAGCEKKGRPQLRWENCVKMGVEKVEEDGKWREGEDW